MAIKVVGLEGGPCGGKTSALKYISEQASERGVWVEPITEIAGQMLGRLSLEGISYADIKTDDNMHYDFQKNLLRGIVDAIEFRRATASSGTLILADRVDNAAFIEPSMYRDICSDLGFKEPPMHSLVDTVLYFPTLAKHDPEKFLQIMDENPARHETSAQQAITTCDANLHTTQNHPDFWLLASTNLERRLVYAGNIALRDFCRQPTQASIM
jgi:hypothetical protein